MKYKYAYQLHKGQEERYSWGRYAVLRMDIFHMSFDRWERLLTIEWKDFPDSYSPGKWYWSNVELQPGLGSGDFDAALNFLNRLNKASVYNNNDPQTVLAWVQKRHGVEQIQFDGRNNRFRTAQEVEAEADKDVYGFYSRPNSLKDYIYATDAETAVNVVEAKIEAGEPYYYESLRDEKHNWYFARVLEGNKPVVLTAEEWDYNPYR